MQVRKLVLIWPLLVAPVMGFATILLSGPTYTTTLSQGAIVFRFLGFVVWFAVAGMGSVITVLLLKSPTKAELLTVLLASLASVLLFYILSTRAP